MGMSRNWFGIVRRKFLTSSSQTVIVLHADTSSTSPSKELTVREQDIDGTAGLKDEENGTASSSSIQKKDFSKEDIAATKIQAIFRRHLALRAFRALRSLVKLQALVRGMCVRRQARTALHCMHALVRLQVRVQARQLLRRVGNN